MISIDYRVSLDMFDVLSQVTIKAKKGDSACKIYITLTEKGKVYKITEGCYATFNAKKSDGTFVYDHCTIEGNTIVYDFGVSIDKDGVCQVSAREGIVECEVTLYTANSKQLTSPRFTLFIDGTVYNGEEIISTPESNVLKELINETNNLIDDVETKLENGDLKGEPGKDAITDQKYNPNSENAQSGIAVDEALQDYVKTSDVDIDYNSGSPNPQSGMAVFQAVDEAEFRAVQAAKEDRELHTDSEYNPESLNAQNGIAVSQAIDGLKQYTNNNFAPVIRNTVSGSVVSAKDISDLQSNLSVKLSSDTVTDFSEVSVKKMGKNWVDINSLARFDNWIHSVDGETKTYSSYKIQLKPNTEYCFGCNPISTGGSIIVVSSIPHKSKDGEIATIINGNYAIGTTKKSFNSGETGVIYVNWYAGSKTQERLTRVVNEVLIDFQIELGTVATEYESYKEPQIVTANDDGTVTGLTSVSPNMTILTDTDGVNIEMTYNADTKRYIDNKFAELSVAILNS